MDTAQRNLERLRPLIVRLTAAVAANDASQLERLLDDLGEARRKDLVSELRRLTLQVRSALETFQFDERFAAFAGKDMPHARQRLAHVMTLTDEAAHQTMGLIEQSGPLVDVLVASHTSPGPELSSAAAQLRRNLSEMLLAQGYQDLTGQIVRSVIKLVGEVEEALSGLTGLTEGTPTQAADAPAFNANGYGPVVPGVEHGSAVGSQHDVDALLSGLGL